MNVPRSLQVEMRTFRLSVLLRIARTLLFFLASIISTQLAAQKKVKLQHSDQLEFNKKEGYQKLIGNVIFTQNQTTIYCDSAYLYKDENSVEAFGRVRITEGDSVTVTGRKLEYDGDTKKAKLRNNVVFVKLNTATLYTDHLDYDRPSNIAIYYNGGKLVDSINTLTSNKGYYDVNSNMASFKKDVHVKNPDYTMTSDSLQYNSGSKVVYFRTPTTAVDNEGKTFVYEGGEYDTKTKRSDFMQGVAESPSYQLQGVDWKLDRIRQLYQIRKDVIMTAKEDNIVIHCEAADYYKDKEVTKAYNNAWVAKVTENNDTLFIRADTLVSIDNPDPAKKRLLAYHNVRIFKTDMQGIADSLEYRAADSLIIFYKNPVLWNKGNQMTADSISMLIQKNTIKRIFMVKNSFVISQDTLLNFNQIKGRNMTAELDSSQINRVYVEGNGESLYFALDEDNKSLSGMNKIVCSNILIRFRKGRVDNFSFYVQPDASFIPPNELKEIDKQLKGFTWKIDERPTREDVVPIP